MLKGLGGASRTVIWGMVLLMSFVGFFSLVAVPLIHPINKSIDYDGCPRCPRAYESFGMARPRSAEPASTPRPVSVGHFASRATWSGNNIGLGSGP